MKILCRHASPGQIMLCGLHPKAILDIASKAIEFYVHQKNIEHEYKASKPSFPVSNVIVVT
jgi:hypothetical protein